MFSGPRAAPAGSKNVSFQPGCGCTSLAGAGSSRSKSSCTLGLNEVRFQRWHSTALISTGNTDREPVGEKTETLRTNLPELAVLVDVIDSGLFKCVSEYFFR